MSALTHSTSFDQGGGVAEAVTADHVGCPDRLCLVSILWLWRDKACTHLCRCTASIAYLIEVTCQPRAVAALQMRDPVYGHESGAIIEPSSLGPSSGRTYQGSHYHLRLQSSSSRLMPWSYVNAMPRGCASSRIALGAPATIDEIKVYKVYKVTFLLYTTVSRHPFHMRW